MVREEGQPAGFLGELVRLRQVPGSSVREGRTVASDLPLRRETGDWNDQCMTPDTSLAKMLGFAKGS